MLLLLALGLYVAALLTMTSPVPDEEMAIVGAVGGTAALLLWLIRRAD